MYLIDKGCMAMDIKGNRAMDDYDTKSKESLYLQSINNALERPRKFKALTRIDFDQDQKKE
jgi:hypothetical protein